ncbi:hypothetical protein [Kibdelosporangium philippinense]|uniref:hypothetical protein n=1 Tax=Kibdelosporangium philippinense TaxID=211113 RepID=UPI00361BEDE1
MSESFFVLSGTLRSHDGEKWRDGSAGDFFYVPPGGAARVPQGDRRTRVHADALRPGRAKGKLLRGAGRTRRYRTDAVLRRPRQLLCLIRPVRGKSPVFHLACSARCTFAQGWLLSIHPWAFSYS